MRIFIILTDFAHRMFMRAT